MADQNVGSQQKIECGHSGCTCLIEPSQSFCSEYCARESTSATSANLPGGKHAGGPCQCGHPDCEANTAQP